MSDQESFLFKPNTIYIPFGADPASLVIPLAKPMAKRDIRLLRGSVESVDPDIRRVRVGGENIHYDYLAVATGASMRPEEIPGLAEHAETIWTPAEMQSLGEELSRLVERARRGDELTILFNVPPFNKCAGPLYEIVFMVETWLRRKGVRDRFTLTYTTFEQSFIQAFGPKLHDVVIDEFTQRGIEGRTEMRLVSVDREQAHFENGDAITHDLLVAFPPYIAAVDYPALSTDERGFIQTDAGSRRVVGHERVFAPGDAGDFPVKQAFLAFLQADAVAEAIVGDLKGRGGARAALAMLTLYQTEWCPHSRRVRQRLTELGVDFIAKQVPARREDRADLRRATGIDHVPVLIVDEGRPLEGSDEILRYLAERFEEPADARVHRAKVREHADA